MKMMSKTVFVAIFCTAFAIGSMTFSGPAVAAGKVEVAVAMHNAQTATIVWGIANRIKDYIETESKGTMTVKLFGPEMGGERDLLEATTRNEFQIVQSGDMGLAMLAPKYAVTSVPFVFPDYTTARKAYAGELGKKMNEALSKSGNLTILGLSQRGARQLTTNKMVFTPSDVKGMKLRVPEIATWVAVWKQIGALPTPVAWPEVFTALQTGVVDSQENPVLQINEAKLYEVQKYIMLTDHLSAFFHWFGNVNFLKGLTPDQRKIVEDAVAKATDWGSRQQEEEAAKLCVEMQDKYGTQFVIPNKYAFFKAAKPAVEKIADKQWAPEVKGLLNEILGQ